MRLCGWVGVVLMAAGCVAQELASGAISGRVAGANGEPLTGVEVTAEGTGRLGVTDDRGVYRIFGLKPGAYYVTIEVDGVRWGYPSGQDRAVPVRVEAGATTGGIDLFALGGHSLPSSAAVGEPVSGRVEDWESGEGIGRVYVRLGDDAGFATWTDEAGRFRFARVPGGEYPITVRKAGYLSELPERMRVQAGPRRVTVKQGEDTDELRLRIVRNGVITGYVMAEERPVAGAMVSANRMVEKDGGRELEQTAAAFTDDRGEFRVYGLTPGKYFVAAVTAAAGEESRAPEPVFFPGALRFAEAATVRVGMDGTPAQLRLEMPLARRRSVRGSVRAPEGVGSVQVRLRPSDPVMALKLGETPADVDERTGHFVVQGVWPGEYEIVASGEASDGKVSGVTPVNLLHGDASDVQVQLTPLLRVVGNVRTKSEPACATNGISIALRDESATIVAHAAVMSDGAFFLEDVKPGTYRVAVSGTSGSCYAAEASNGHSSDAMHLSLMDGSNTIQVVLANDGAKVSGEVVSASARPLPGKRVVLSPIGRELSPEQSVRSAVSDREGKFFFEGVRPGSYELAELSDDIGDEETPSSTRIAFEVRANEMPFMKLVEGR